MEGCACEHPWEGIKTLFLLTFHELAFPYQKISLLRISRIQSMRECSSFRSSLPWNLIQAACCATLSKLLYISGPPLPLQKCRETVLSRMAVLRIVLKSNTPGPKKGLISSLPFGGFPTASTLNLDLIHA